MATVINLNTLEADTAREAIIQSADQLTANGLTVKQALAAYAIKCGYQCDKIGLLQVTNLETRERKAALVALPPEDMGDDAPVIPLAILIDGNVFEQFAPTVFEDEALEAYAAHKEASADHKQAA